MNIALFYAMPSEIDSLIQGAAPMETVHGVSFYRIRPNVIACCGGVGKVNAAMAAAVLIDRYHPDLILNAGVAGCFEEVPIGTLVLAEKFVQHDVDTTGVGDPIGLVSTVNRVDFPTAPARWPPATGSASPVSGPTGCVTPSIPCCARWRAARRRRCAIAAACPLWR